MEIFIFGAILMYQFRHKMTIQIDDDINQKEPKYLKIFIQEIRKIFRQSTIKPLQEAYHRINVNVNSKEVIFIWVKFNVLDSHLTQI